MDDARGGKNIPFPCRKKRKKRNETSGGFNRSRATLNGFTSFLHLSPSNEREPASEERWTKSEATCIALCFILLFGKRRRGRGKSKGEPINFVAFLAFSKRLFAVMGVRCFSFLFFFFSMVKTIAKFVDHDLTRQGERFVGKKKWKRSRMIEDSRGRSSECESIFHPRLNGEGINIHNFCKHGYKKHPCFRVVNWTTPFWDE